MSRSRGRQAPAERQVPAGRAHHHRWLPPPPHKPPPLGATPALTAHDHRFQRQLERFQEAHRDKVSITPASHGTAPEPAQHANKTKVSDKAELVPIPVQSGVNKGFKVNTVAGFRRFRSKDLQEEAEGRAALFCEIYIRIYIYIYKMDRHGRFPFKTCMKMNTSAPP